MCKIVSFFGQSVYIINNLLPYVYSEDIQVPVFGIELWTLLDNG